MRQFYLSCAGLRLLSSPSTNINSLRRCLVGLLLSEDTFVSNICSPLVTVVTDYAFSKMSRGRRGSRGSRRAGAGGASGRRKSSLILAFPACYRMSTNRI
jgi:hypothetical protein